MEKLHPELAKHKFVAEIGEMIHHPLLITFPYVEQMNHVYNNQLETKQKLLSIAVKNEDWSHYVFLHERPYRIDALYAIRDLVGADQSEFAELIKAVYTDSENIYENYDSWHELLIDNPVFVRSPFKDRELTIYRGYTHEDSRIGFSWTTDVGVAIWFAKRFAEDHGLEPKVVKAKIKELDIIFDYDGRGEHEVVVDHYCLYAVENIEVE